MFLIWNTGAFFCLLIPAAGEPVLVVSSPEYNPNLVTVKDVRYHADFSGEICKAMKELNMEQETIETALELTKKDPKIKALLLECSVLPPYGKVQQATGLPVFDFITMIDYVHSSLVKKDYLKH